MIKLNKKLSLIFLFFGWGIYGEAAQYIEQLKAHVLQRNGAGEWVYTIIGPKRIDNILFCMETVLQDNIPGDMIETGVWRGGATIFMRGVLKAYEIQDRYVWAADSFQGLPVPDLVNYPLNALDGQMSDLSKEKWLKVSLEQVKKNFNEFGLLDDQVIFLKGWFKDTLPNAPIKKIAVLRLDGDIYESTIQALESLYSKVSVGGFVIVDDYGYFKGCRRAVDDFKAKNNSLEEIHWVDHTCVYWRKEK